MRLSQVTRTTVSPPPSQETFAKLRHSGESRPFTGRNVHPEGLGKRGSDYQCVGLKRWPGVLQRPLHKGGTLQGKGGYDMVV